MGIGLYIILGVSWLLQLLYILLMLNYFKGWKNTPFFEPKASATSTSISVIVVARNETDSIQSCINSILKQNYPKALFELIVVDDFSTDNTFNIISTYENHQVIGLKNDSPGKKSAITKAIAQAKGELIVTTDADCITPPNWLKTISSYYEAYHPKLITGLVKINFTNSILSKFQALDMIGMMGVTAAAIQIGKPQMCNGANMAYPKQVFETVNGYAGINHWPTGDDQLLMFKILKLFPEGIHFLKSKETIITTKSTSSWLQLWHQRLRWVSKAKAMPKINVSLILLFAYSYNLSLLVLLTVGFVLFLYTGGSFFSGQIFGGGLFLLIIKLVFELPLLRKVSTFLNQSKLLKNYIVIQLLHILYVVLIGPAGQFFNYKWKGRLLKPIR